MTLALEAALPWNLQGNEALYAECFGVGPEGLPQAFKNLLEASRFAAAVQRIEAGVLSAHDLAAAMQAPESQPMLKNNVPRGYIGDQNAPATPVPDVRFASPLTSEPIGAKVNLSPAIVCNQTCTAAADLLEVPYKTRLV